MRRKMMLACVVLVLAAPFALAQPANDKDLLVPHLAVLGHAQKEIRLSALKQIGALGIAGRSAAAKVGWHMQEDPDAKVADQAAHTLAQIGPAGVPELIKGVEHPTAAVRTRALASLGLMGPMAKEAVDVLKSALKDKEPALRVLAAAALGDMGKAAEPAIPGLCQSLKDRDTKVRTQAALALRNLGVAAMPPLQEMLADDDRDTRLRALQAAALIGPDAKVAAKDLAESLKGDSPPLRVAAADALGSIGPDAKDAIPALTALMRDKNGEVQQHVFQAILRIGSDDVPGLLDTMRKVNAEAHWAFPFVLRQFGPKGKDAVKPLIKQLDLADDGARMSAALALAQIGEDAREAVGALQRLLNKDPNPMVRHSAAFALNRITTDRHAERVKQMQAAAEQIDNNLKRAIANCLMPKVPRPVNRQALTDPRVQGFYDQIILGHIWNSTQVAGCRPRPQATAHLGAKALLNRDNIMIPDFKRGNEPHPVLPELGPEAIPALIRGINLIGYYQIGFC